MKLLPLGTTLYMLEESITDRWFHVIPYHYEIVSGEISRINHGGFNEYVVQTCNRLGHKSCLRFIKTSDVGKRSAWLTYAEAVEAAEKATDRYEQVWGKYLEEKVMMPWRDENANGQKTLSTRLEPDSASSKTGC